MIENYDANLMYYLWGILKTGPYSWFAHLQRYFPPVWLLMWLTPTQLPLNPLLIPKNNRENSTIENKL